MDIRVGGSAPVGPPGDKQQPTEGAVEARLLAVRAPRQRSLGPPAVTERREAGAQRDPITGRVLVLLVPDGSRLPAGLETGEYRIFVRFARK